jgi:nitrite reductase/ring-hydroxylating ferredoxin subunit
VAGAVSATAAGWLGGHLAYALGVGVDTNAFDGGPTEWTAVSGQPADPGSFSSGSAGAVSLVVVGSDTDAVSEGRRRPRVLANRCSHRGGPLAEGELVGDCLRCPWHGSEFDISTGQVRRHPATITQPVYQARLQAGAPEVRRDEPRSLRVNPVRP